MLAKSKFHLIKDAIPKTITISDKLVMIIAKDCLTFLYLITTTTAAEKSAVISFLVKKIHPYDIGMLLDKLGIAVRTGHHCAQPLMDFLEIPGTVRVSFALYNTKEEIDVFVSALKKVVLMLS